MSNVVGELVYDVLNRINAPNLREFKEIEVLRAMRRVYAELNRECKCVQRTYELTADNREDDEDYWELPSDFIELYVKEGNARSDYVTAKISSFDFDTQYQFAIENDGGTQKIIIPDAPSDFGLILHYYSLGKILVNAEDAEVLANETNTPEWPGMDLHNILICGTAIRLSKKYDFYEEDRYEFARLKGRLLNQKLVRQSADYESGGGYELMERQ